MKKKIWLIAGVAGMLLGMPQFTAQAHYGDGYPHRHGYDRYSRYDHRHGDDRYDRGRYDRGRYDRERYEREERRRRWREEERRRRYHRHEHRDGIYIRP